MADIGQLKLQLTANSDGVVREMDRVQRRTSRLQGAVNRAGNAIAQAGSQFAAPFLAMLNPAVLAAAAIAAITLHVNQLRNSLDRTAKTADRLGISVEFLQVAEDAIVKQGGNVGQLNQIFSTYSRQIGLAAQGTGEAVTALQQLGLSAQQLQAMGLERGFGLVTERLGQVQSPEQRAAIASRIFGEGGGQQLLFLQNFGDQFADSSRRLQQAAFILDRQSLAQVETMNDRLEDLSKTTEAFWRQFTAAIAPTMILILTDLAQNIQLLSGTLQDMRPMFRLLAALQRFSGSAWINRIANEGLNAFSPEGLVRAGMEVQEIFRNQTLPGSTPQRPSLPVLPAVAIGSPEAALFGSSEAARSILANLRGDPFRAEQRTFQMNMENYVRDIRDNLNPEQPVNL